MQAHRYAAIFPLLDDDDLADLAADIKRHGQRETVLTYEGQILDGRNRWRACELAGIPCRTEEAGVADDLEAIELVMSLNLRRRHLTGGQREMAGARALPMHEEAARKRMLAGVKQESNNPGAHGRQGPAKRAPKSAEFAAAAVGSSPRQIERAKVVLTKAEPEVVQAVDHGALAVRAASEAARLAPEEQREVVRLVTTGEAKSGAAAIREVTKRPHVTHNSGENEWYTPPRFIEAARDVLGGIDLDPASCEIANARVEASTFYTKDDDGLSQEWAGRVWMNPPYEKGLIDKFCGKLAAEFDAGRVTAAVVLVNNGTDTQWFARLAASASALCLPTGRVRFLSPSGEKGAPLQGQAVVYMGPDPDSFCARFAQFGTVAEVRHGV